MSAPLPVPTFVQWVSSTANTAQSLADRVVVGGMEGTDSSALWVIRAQHGGEVIPGKLAVRQNRAYIPFEGKEVGANNFEVLCAPAHLIRWLPASNGQVPTGAIPAGNTRTGEILYVGRASHAGSLTPGKVQPSHSGVYISYGGNEARHTHYEVLCDTRASLLQGSRTN